MADQVRTTVRGMGEIFDGPHATPVRRKDGPYFLNISSLKSGRLDLAESDHVSAEDFKKWTRRVTPRENDLLFSYETRLGEAALMPAGVEACLGRRMALLRPDLSVVDPRFLLYFYLSPSFQGTIQEHMIHGATVPRIGLATMPNWEVVIPQLPEQRAIAEVLCALDDKIAANDRELVAAEALMVALAGKSRELTKVGALAAQSTRAIKPTEFPERVAHFSLPAFDEGKLPEDAEHGSIKSNKFLLKEPCVLMSKLNPRIPRIWDVGALPKTLSVASTEFVVLVPRSTSSALLWAVLCAPKVSTQLEGLVAGTSGSHQRVRPAQMLDVDVPDPRSLDESTTDSVTALGALTQGRRLESQQLARTRDELLPLLMSGKVRVKDVEKHVEGAL